METTKHQKAGSFKRICVLMIVMLISLSNVLNAQCTAGYTSVVDPANNGDVAFTNTSSGTGLTYYWDFGDGTTSALMNPLHTYLFTSTYTACLTIYDSLGMFDSTLGCYTNYCSSISVINTAGGVLCNASYTSVADTATSGLFSFNNTSAGTGLNYSWSFGDGTSSALMNPSHTYTTPGMYMACLTISNFMGTCSDSYCDTIFYSSVPSGACLGIVNTMFTVSDSMNWGYFGNTPSDTNQVYFWDFGDGSNSSAFGSTTHYYPSPGTYTVCLTVYETGAGTDSCQYCSVITIPTSPACSAYFSVVQDSTNIYNYFVYNYASSALGGPLTYLWDFGDGTSSTLAYPSHNYATTSTVLLCLTITDGFGCTDSYCDSITPGSALMPGVFNVTVLSPNGITEQTIVSTLENYPNPFSGNTTINYSINKDANVTISIVDLLGNTIAAIESGNKPAGSHSLQWNAENVSAGLYMLQLKVNNTVSTKKLLITK